MNILFINSFDCSPTNSGGVNRTVYILSRYLMKKNGYRCFLGYYEDNPVRPLADFDGKIKLKTNFDAEEFENFLTDNNIDVVQVNFLKKENLHTIPIICDIARRRGVKVLYCLHVAPAFETVTYGTFARVWYSITHGERWTVELRRWLITATHGLIKPVAFRLIRKKYLMPYQVSDKTVLLSANYRQPYLEIIGQKDAGKFEAIGNALTFSEFATEQDIEAKQKQVLMVARFDEFSKRMSLALKIWRQVERDHRFDDWTLTLVGTGEAMNYYQYLVKKWGLKRVVFTGLQKPMEYYRAASVFLMTSAAEGWPMTLGESLQMGTPVVAFDSFGALHDLVEDGINGRIVANNDMDAFYDALTDIMLDEKKRQQMSRNAIEKSHEFEIGNIVDKWVKLHQRL
jgi:glycosyltransferase involved in cell wall biosynthesis